MTETVTTGRAKRSTAGNRMRELLEQAHKQNEEDELFAEDEDDVEFVEPQDQKDVFLEEFADTDDEKDDDDDEEVTLQKEERRQQKSKAAFNPLVKAGRVSDWSTLKPKDSDLALLDPTIDVAKMAPSTLILEIRKQRREQKRQQRSETRRSNLRASTLKSEVELIEKEKAEKVALASSRKGRKAQHETGEVRGARPMTQDELIAAALEEEERNKEALTDWLRKEEERRELRRVGRKRVRGPRWTWVSRTVGKLVEVVEEDKEAAAAGESASAVASGSTAQVPEDSKAKTEQSSHPDPVSEYGETAEAGGKSSIEEGISNESAGPHDAPSSSLPEDATVHARPRTDAPAPAPADAAPSAIPDGLSTPAADSAPNDAHSVTTRAPIAPSDAPAPAAEVAKPSDAPSSIPVAAATVDVPAPPSTADSAPASTTVAAAASPTTPPAKADSAPTSTTPDPSAGDKAHSVINDSSAPAAPPVEVPPKVEAPPGDGAGPVPVESTTTHVAAPDASVVSVPAAESISTPAAAQDDATAQAAPIETAATASQPTLPTKDESEAATKDDGSPAASRDDATTKPEKSVESAAKPTTAEASAEPAAKPTAGDPPADPEAPTGPYTRNYLILSQVPGGLESELSLILGDHVDWSNVKVIPARNRPINRKPPMDPLCGSAAKYRHPESMVPFSSVESFKTIEAVLAGRYIWDAAGWWAGGEADAFAEGIEEIEGWREASCRRWLGGKEVEEAVEEEPIGVETLEAVEEDPVEEEPEPEPEPPAPAPAPKRPRKSTSRASTSQKRKATSEPAEEPEEEKKPAKKSRSSKSKRRR